MKNRVQLTDQDLDNVVGGAFNFYTKDTENRCYIDGMGTYLCSPEASAWVVKQITSGVPTADVLAQAVENGLFWK